MRILASTAALALASCATVPNEPPSLDQLARDYLAVQLAIGEKDPGYVDAYYGPEELATKAASEDARMSLPMLQARVVALDATLSAIPVDPGTLEAERVRYLRAMLASAKTRLRMLRGETIPFQDEAEGLFGVRPEMIELASLDPVLARIEEFVPGDEADGPLSERINAWRDRFVIPEDRMRAVIDRAVEECRARTVPHIPLPESESFSLSLVTDKPWGGFNYYQGDYHSVIEINTDVPARIDRAVDVGCHEAYPGHHVYSTLIERERVNALGQVEYTLLPLYSPRAIVSEGSAEYAVKLAFPGNTQMEFERDVLAPLAGIDASAIADYYALREATQELGPAYYTIAAAYLDGTADREATIADLMRYQLSSRGRAEQSLEFLDTYRSYVINYDLGSAIVGAFVERGDADMATRWERFIGILSTPTLPEDLR
ncbi:hypothetical protein [Alteraurantiacibacter aquimixticola]|uniref:DUF885 domain-containing protein n=1 Tax=Alteraurantiacibacter aquimixticola TaxID=2489173 RepID=A0A4T3F236_9SPHN|nr:hypothetical protein [Alteraurantiacibacter aquimixticola]TIX50355.1 hypothetical protein E5222_08735 [Alteraurantiacibacter aquimixticola]